MRLQIHGGTLVTASETSRVDVWIEDQTIVAVTGPGEPAAPADRTFDASGCLVLPGAVDVHTHLDMPVGELTSSDDFETGTIAAACGGTTTIVDYIGHARGESLRQNVDAWHARAMGKAVVDYGFHMTIAGAPVSVLDEMGGLVDDGITSFKVFLAYPERLLLDDPSILRVMLRARELGALVCVHAEAGPAVDVLVERALAMGHTAPIHHALTRPEAAEATGTDRAIALAELAGASVYIVHLSCEQALARVREARRRGLPVLAETCPQYLFLCEDDLRGAPNDRLAAARFVCTPPLRPAWHQQHLWHGIHTGDLQVVATDHCPFTGKGITDEQRADFTRIPNGLPGIETRLLLLYEAVRQNKISVNQWVDIACTAPARIFGLYPRKGSLMPGADADVVIWDPHRAIRLDHENLHMRVDYSPYQGREAPGSPRWVLSRGEVIVEKGSFQGRKGRGRYIPRAASSAAGDSCTLLNSKQSVRCRTIHGEPPAPGGGP